MPIERFTPVKGGLVSTAGVTTISDTSANVQVSVASGSTHVLLTNKGTDVIFVALAATSALAVAVDGTSFPMAPNSQTLVALRPDLANAASFYAAAVGPNGSSNKFYVTAGTVA